MVTILSMSLTTGVPKSSRRKYKVIPFIVGKKEN
jgi:hypothetical protein